MGSGLKEALKSINLTIELEKVLNIELVVLLSYFTSSVVMYERYGREIPSEVVVKNV